jgi:molybdate transport system regulatory protein
MSLKCPCDRNEPAPPPLSPPRESGAGDRPPEPSPPGSPSPSSPPGLRPRVKVWFEAEGGYSFGSGLIAILQAVDRAGSIKQAAVDLGQSYRHVWGRIKKAEQALGSPLVDTQVGGQAVQRSGLTANARRLVDDFLALRHRMVESMEQARQALGPSDNSPPTTFH